MPIAMDPKQRFEICLDSDESADPRPAFVCKQLTAREWIEVSRIGEEVGNASVVVALEAIFSALRIAFVDWKNIKREDGSPWDYAPGDLENLLTPSEASELLDKVLKGCTPGAQDAKKSASPSPSSSGSSARVAGEGDVSTNPATSSPSNSHVPGAMKKVATIAGEPDASR